MQSVAHSGLVHKSFKSCGDTPQIKCVSLWSFSWGVGDREGSRVRVKFVGLKIWSEMGNRERGKGSSGPPSRGPQAGLQALVLVHSLVSETFWLFPSIGKAAGEQ